MAGEPRNPLTRLDFAIEAGRERQPAREVISDRVAPFAFVLLWSSSFIAARAGLRHMTPLLFVALRIALCAAVLVLVVAVLGRSWRVMQGWWLHCAIAGILVHGVLLMTAH